MKYRTLGRTNWRVSEIAFGAWQLGGTWGEIDDGESMRTLLAAFESGINFVDTAALYGAGRSELVVGRALTEWRRDKVYVATKVPPVIWPDPDDLDAPMRGMYPEAYLQEQVEGCLRRLGVERIDLLQLHAWIPRGCIELDWLEGLCRLRRAGKIDRFGVSLRDIRPAQGVELASLALVDVQQVMFNMFEQEPVEALFPAGQQTGVGFLARVPLDSGALSGTWNVDTYSSWSPDDKRHSMYRGQRFAETLQRVHSLQQLCRPHFPNLAEAALRFCLSEQAVGSIVCGMRNAEEVRQNVACSDGAEFPAELRAALEAHAWKHEFYH